VSDVYKGQVLPLWLLDFNNSSILAVDAFKD